MLEKLPREISLHIINELPAQFNWWSTQNVCRTWRNLVTLQKNKGLKIGDKLALEIVLDAGRKPIRLELYAFGGGRAVFGCVFFGNHIQRIEKGHIEVPFAFSDFFDGYARINLSPG